MPEKNGLVKLNLELSEDVNDKLKAVAARAGTTPSEVLRRGLRLYDIATEAKVKGLKVGLLEEDHTFVTEIDGI